MTSPGFWGRRAGDEGATLRSKGQRQRRTPSIEPVGQTPFHRNTGVPLALPVQNRRRFCRLESLAEPVAHFVNKPLIRTPKSSMAPRAVYEMSEGTTSATSCWMSTRAMGPCYRPSFTGSARRLSATVSFKRRDRGDAEVRRETSATRTLRSCASLRTPRLDSDINE